MDNVIKIPERRLKRLLVGLLKNKPYYSNLTNAIVREHGREFPELGDGEWDCADVPASFRGYLKPKYGEGGF